MKKLSLFLMAMVLVMVCNAQEIERKSYSTGYTETPPVIDGYIDDPCWAKVEWTGNFTQSSPYDNKPPTQQTEFKILYDNDNVYVFISAHDSDVNKISSILTRRDGFQGDMVEIYFDSYYDKQTAFSFTAMASGAKGDEAVSQNGNNWDASWNPIWTLKTSIDDKGWNAELKIPLTQLRFGNKEEHIWGLQVMRYIHREDERSYWQYIPKGSPGTIHLYGELHGIKNIKPKRQVELMPYMLAKYENFKKEEGNPFKDGDSWGLSAGLDGKIGLTNDFTLDFTVNPDFGQVEADPSEVNLTAFETYLSEQRPFFVEGKSIYQFRPSSPTVINNLGSDNLFYSRRIGRSPQHDIDISDTEFMDKPDATTILGAAKISGKTKNGVSIGILESLTSEEKAEIDNDGDRRTESVEPLTNYLVTRVQKDFNKGESNLGGMFTAVNRDINNPDMDLLKSSYAGGIDFKHSWKERTWYVSGTGTYSYIKGNENALIKVQSSSARYYQRPDADHLTMDSSLTTLSGYGSSFKFGRQGQKKIQFETSVNFRSPGLEFNDLGYMRYSDLIHHGTWFAYYIRDPFSIFRNFYLNTNYWLYWNFDGELLSKNVNLNFNCQLKNKWYLNGSASRLSENLSTSILRGGPAFIVPGTWEYNFNVTSDQSKKVYFYTGMYHNWKEVCTTSNTENWAGIFIRPINSVSISIEPEFSKSLNELQHVNELDYNKEKRYLFAEIDQKTMSLTLRINYTITPDLTIQYYGQPYISTGRYSNFKRITEPHANEYKNRFHVFDENEIFYNNAGDSLNMNENGDALIDYSIENPDFSFKQFKSNLVLRWEYARGSFLYLVWSQGKTNSGSTGNFDYWKNIDELFEQKAHNVFLIKLSYWFSL
jgi:hypothetical protein